MLKEKPRRLPNLMRSGQRRWILNIGLFLAAFGLLSHYASRQEAAIEAVLKTPLSGWQRGFQGADRSAAGLHHDLKRHVPITRIVGHSPGTTVSLARDYVGSYSSQPVSPTDSGQSIYLERGKRLPLQLQELTDIPSSWKTMYIVTSDPSSLPKLWHINSGRSSSNCSGRTTQL